MSNLIEFYTKTATSLGLKIGAGDVISVDGVELIIENKPLVLPTEDNIKTLVAKNDDGTVSITKVLYNPLVENALKGDGPGITKMSYVARVMLASSIASCGKLLLILAKNKENQKSTPVFINEFLGKLGKEPIDDRSIENWTKCCEKAGELCININSKKLGSWGGEKFIRLASLTYSILDELRNNKEHIVHGHKIRARDREVFIALCELFLPDAEIVGEDKTNILYYGTNDKISPSFVALFGLINKVGSIIAKVKKALISLDETLSDEIMDWTLTNDEIILAPTNYKTFVEMIPSDMDIINSISKDTSSKESHTVSIINKQTPSLSTMVNPNTIGIGNGFVALNNNNKAVTATPVVEEEISPIDKILGRRTSASTTTEHTFNPFGTPVNQTVIQQPTAIDLLRNTMAGGMQYSVPNSAIDMLRMSMGGVQTQQYNTLGTFMPNVRL